MIEAQLPDGTVLEFPEGTASDVMQRAVKQQLGIKAEPAPAPLEQPAPNTGLETGRMRRPVVTGQIRNSPMDIAADQATGNAVAGLVRGAGSIGSTILAPWDMAVDAANGKGLSLESNRQRRADMDAGLQTMGAQPESGLYKAGKVAGEIAGTAGVGGALANGARAVGATPAVVNTLASGGMNASGVTGLPGLLLRGAGGAAVGGTAAGMVNPEDAGIGAIVGGAVPVSARSVAEGGRWLGRTIRGDVVAPEVIGLADRARQLGIEVPADRIANSKPLDAAAATLEYMPFSGRAATNQRMTDQLNTAVSRTFGQNSPNVTASLRRASHELGAEFDRVLRGNTVQVDGQLVSELTDRATQAGRVLNAGDARIIQNQIDDIIGRGAGGAIDGQAAYNIKRTLDEISKRSSPEAFHARELRNSLMGALNRSLGPDEAAAFATTRQHYGAMRKLENLAQNGAEGDISIGRLANLKNIRNDDLQELADISAQFLKTRESPHGALQRLVIGGTGLGAASGSGGIPIGLGLLAGGRATNSLLNSEVLRNAVMGRASTNPLLGNSMRMGLLGASKAAPILTAQ